MTICFDISAAVHRRAGLGRWARDLARFREDLAGRPARAQLNVSRFLSH